MPRQIKVLQWLLVTGLTAFVAFSCHAIGSAERSAALSIPTQADDRATKDGDLATSTASRTAPPTNGQIVAEDYRIGPQDLIEIQVYGLENLRREVRVNSRGVVSLPLIGPVTLGGLTAQEGEALISAKYEKDYLRNPQVSLFIKEFTSQRITIEGAVQRPGVFPIKGQTSLLQALAIAGGGAQLADMTEVMLFRTENGARKATKYDVPKIRSGELPDPVLMNDDLIVVNRSSARTALKDSLFRDILDTINPFNWGR